EKTRPRQDLAEGSKRFEDRHARAETLFNFARRHAHLALGAEDRSGPAAMGENPFVADDEIADAAGPVAAALRREIERRREFELVLDPESLLVDQRTRKCTAARG